MTAPQEPSFPSMAVVICTRHRAASTTDAVMSALASRPGPVAVIVIDQAAPGSDDPLAACGTDPRFRCVRFAGHGLARARNMGMVAAEAAGATVVAFTDDDCVADPGWLGAFGRIFAAHPDVALAFGSTLVAPHDRTAGTIPGYVVRRTSLHRGIASKSEIEAMGACMAVRVGHWRAIGGFDDWFGAGADLASADENEFSIRMLWQGFSVAETPEAHVIHHGLRPRADVGRLMAGYMRGSGAATAKMLRLVGLRGLLPVAKIGRRWVGGRSAVTVDFLPSRRARLAAFLRGMVVGLCASLDRSTGRFKPSLGPEDIPPPPPRSHAPPPVFQPR